MPKKVKEVVAILEQNGWTLARQCGSHRTYKPRIAGDCQRPVEQHDDRGYAHQRPPCERN